MIKKQGAY